MWSLYHILMERRNAASLPACRPEGGRGASAPGGKGPGGGEGRAAAGLARAGEGRRTAGARGPRGGPELPDAASERGDPDRRSVGADLQVLHRGRGQAGSQGGPGRAPV